MADEPTFEELLAASQRSAVHLEMRDGYSTTGAAFAAWRVDHSVSPLTWYGTWHDIVGAAVRRGVLVRRARIVSEPVSEYIRFEHDFTGPLNVAAGEEVRWLPRRRATDIALPGNDFWLFDDRLVQINHFPVTARPWRTRRRRILPSCSCVPPASPRFGSGRCRTRDTGPPDNAPCPLPPPVSSKPVGRWANVCARSARTPA